MKPVWGLGDSYIPPLFINSKYNQYGKENIRYQNKEDSRKW